MRVTIIGPNLRDQSRGSMHVHRAGCADIARQASRDPEFRHGWTIDVDSRLEAVEATYEDIIAEGECSADDCAGEFYFAPCVDLPYRA